MLTRLVPADIWGTPGFVPADTWGTPGFVPADTWGTPGFAYSSHRKYSRELCSENISYAIIKSGTYKMESLVLLLCGGGQFV